MEHNTGLNSPLLSRFDLTFIVTDVIDVQADNENCDFILERFMKPEDRILSKVQEDDNIWKIDKFRNYCLKINKTE